MVTHRNNKSDLIKLIAIGELMAIVFTLLFSLAFIAEQANHVCEGEHCSVCDRIMQCENNINTHASGKDKSVFAIRVIFAFVSVCVFVGLTDSKCTLITQKVRLNN